jgi:GNAT superfamily N-acetyltransferase
MTEAASLRIDRLSAAPVVIEDLANLLIAVVEAGASVSFMAPLAPEKARAHWAFALAEASAGRRVVLGAYAGPTLVGTVSLNLDMPENQPHRADVIKMLVAPEHRRQGIAEKLLAALEAEARSLGRTVLVLVTVVGDSGDRLYARVGWIRVGEIPDYALMPDGRLCATAIYWKAV